MASVIVERKSEIWQQTEVKRKDSREWIIQNYKAVSSSKQQNEKIESPTFTSGTKPECNWRLDLYPSYPGMLFFKLILLKDSPDIIDNRIVNITLSLLNANKEEKNKTIHDASATAIRPTADFYDRFTIMEDVFDINKNFLLNDSLTVLIEITTIVRNSTTHTKGDNNNDMSDSPLQDRLSVFLENEQFCDITLNIKGTKLKAHKLLLCAQSSVFASLLKYDALKNQRDIFIDDLEPEVAKQMLIFVYTDNEPPRIDEMTNELIIAAFKYKMHKLRMMCERILIRRININNAIDILSFANIYGSDRLKEEAIEYIRTDLSLIESTKFVELEIQNAELARETYRKLLLKKRKMSNEIK